MPNETKKYKCPYCEEFIDKVNYHCYASGAEWGTAVIDIDDTYSGFTDHTCDDSECNDTSDYVYSCPECDHEVDIEDFKNQEDEEDEENEEEETCEPDDAQYSKLLSARQNYIQNNVTLNVIQECPFCRCINIIGDEEHSFQCSKCDKIVLIK